MKKILVSFLTAIILSTCLFMVACGGTSGTYKISYIVIDGESYDVGEEIDGIVIPDDLAVIELKSNGDAKVRMIGLEKVGTWVESDNIVTITYGDGLEVELEHNGDILKFKEDGRIMVLKK